MGMIAHYLLFKMKCLRMVTSLPLLVLFFPFSGLASEAFNFPPPKLDYQALCVQHEIPGNIKNLAIRDAALSPSDQLKRAVYLLEGDAQTLPDPNRAVQLLNTLATSSEKGMIPNRAGYYLARQLLKGEGTATDAKRAYDLLLKAAAYEPKSASFLLGVLKEQQGDYLSAADYYQQSAVAGNPGAYLVLSFLYRKGLVTPPPDGSAELSLALAQNYLTEQIAKGECGALENIGTILLSKKYIPRDEALAAQWLEASSLAGNVSSMLKLADLYRVGADVERNLPRAVDLWRKAAESGNPEALWNLGFYTQTVDGPQKNVSLALNLYEKAALRGHPLALKRLVATYRGEYDLPPDEDKAAKWLLFAAKQTSPDAELLYQLGEAYAYGYGLGQNDEAAFSAYEQAAQMGHPNALVRVGDFYSRGKVPNSTPIHAYRFYRLAAQKGDGEAMLRLADHYRCGIGKPADPDLAIRWEERAVYDGAGKVTMPRIRAALASDNLDSQQEGLRLLMRRVKGNDPEAKILLGYAYLTGQGVKKNRKQADILFADGSEDPLGMVALAQLYLEGNGVDQNQLKAYKLFESAASMGSSSAHYELGKLLKQGAPGIPASLGEAQARFRSAATKGHIAAMIKLATLLKDDAPQEAREWLLRAALHGEITAMLELARAYHQGNWLQKDPAQARHWVDEAKAYHPCDSKDRMALAQAYLEGMAGEEEKVMAFKWLSEAAKAGDMNAMYTLGNLLLHGNATTANPKEAMHWFELAANAGHADAMYELATGYATGYGITFSEQQAKHWLKQAALAGNAVAKTQLSMMP